MNTYVGTELQGILLLNVSSHSMTYQGPVSMLLCLKYATHTHSFFCPPHARSAVLRGHVGMRTMAAIGFMTVTERVSGYIARFMRLSD